MFIGLRFLNLPAPSGAECKLNAPKHMALRWSAELLRYSGYKHRAPLEHFSMDHYVKPVFGQSDCNLEKLTGSAVYSSCIEDW